MKRNVSLIADQVLCDGVMFPNDIFVLLVARMDVVSKFRLASTSKNLNQLVHFHTDNIVGAESEVTDAVLMTLPNITTLGDVFWDGGVSNKVLEKLTRLRELHLGSSEHITNDTLLKLTNLESLHLGDNYMIGDAALYNKKKLTSLNLDRWELHDFSNTMYCWITPSCLTTIVSLTSLSLKGNYHIYDQDLLPLTNLTKLSLQFENRITDDGLARLTQLTYLDIGWNDAISGSCFSSLCNITELRVTQEYEASEAFESKHLKFLTQLKKLHADGNVPLQGNLCKLSTLTYLDVSYNKNAFLHDLSMLPNLTTLNMRYTCKSSVTSSPISHMTNLTDISLDPPLYRYLKDLPNLTRID